MSKKITKKLSLSYIRGSLIKVLVNTAVPPPQEHISSHKAPVVRTHGQDGETSSQEGQVGRIHGPRGETPSQEAQIGRIHGPRGKTPSQEARVGRIHGPGETPSQEAQGVGTHSQHREASHPQKKRILPWIQPHLQSDNPNLEDNWPSQTTPNPLTMASNHRAQQSSREALVVRAHRPHGETSHQKAQVTRINGLHKEASHLQKKRILPWVQSRLQSDNPNSDDDWPSQTTPNPPTMASTHRARQSSWDPPDLQTNSQHGKTSSQAAQVSRTYGLHQQTSSQDTQRVWTHGQQRKILPWVQSRLQTDNPDLEDDWVSQTTSNPPTMASDHRARQSSSSILSSFRASTVSRVPGLDRNVQPKNSRERNYPVRTQDQEDWRRQQAEETSRIEAIAAEKGWNASRPTQRRPRRPWLATETDRLLDLWKRYGNNWAVIKEEDEHMAPSVLGDRSIVDLKDKMRTVKIGLLR